MPSKAVGRDPSYLSVYIQFVDINIPSYFLINLSFTSLILQLQIILIVL